MSKWTQIIDRYIREGRTVSGGCGATQQENQVSQAQQQNFQTLTNQASQEFGDSSQIFSELQSSFAPIVAAGPGQNGYTPTELSALNSAAITNTGNQYRNAATAAKEGIAASGGGNAVLPSGAVAQEEGNIATAGAAQTSNALNTISINNAQQGLANWQNAADVLAGAPGVFNAATNAENAATTAGQVAMSGTQTIQNADSQLQGEIFEGAGIAGQTVAQSL